MDQKYGEFVGVDSLYFARVSKNDSAGYIAGTPRILAPAADVAAAVGINKLTTYYDNLAANSYVTEAATEITMVVANMDAETLAEILGKTFDPATGRVFDAGTANPPVSQKAHYVFCTDRNIFSDIRHRVQKPPPRLVWALL